MSEDVYVEIFLSVRLNNLILPVQFIQQFNRNVSSTDSAHPKKPLSTPGSDLIKQHPKCNVNI